MASRIEGQLFIVILTVVIGVALAPLLDVFAAILGECLLTSDEKFFSEFFEYKPLFPALRPGFVTGVAVYNQTLRG